MPNFSPEENIPVEVYGPPEILKKKDEDRNKELENIVSESIKIMSEEMLSGNLSEEYFLNICHEIKYFKSWTKEGSYPHYYMALPLSYYCQKDINLPRESKKSINRILEWYEKYYYRKLMFESEFKRDALVMELESYKIELYKSLAKASKFKPQYILDYLQIKENMENAEIDMLDGSFPKWFDHIDAGNVDIKCFTEEVLLAIKNFNDFYKKKYKN